MEIIRFLLIFLICSCSKPQVSDSELIPILNRGGRVQLEEVAVNNLPKNIKKYIEKNFENAEIRRAGREKEGNFHVGIHFNHEPKGLLFDAKGNFKEELPKPNKLPPMEGGGSGKDLKPFPTKDLPKSISIYLSEKYKDFKIEDSKLDGRNHFHVIFSTENKKKIIIFDENGLFLEELKPREGMPPPK